MSMTARHENRKARQLCQRCRDRKARFQYRGEVSRDHTLCFECYRSERERQRALRVSWAESPMLRPLVGAAPALSERQIAHRRQMVAHLGQLP